MISLVALVHSIINFKIRLLQSHFLDHHLQMFLNYLELFTGFAEQFMMVL